MAMKKKPGTKLKAPSKPIADLRPLHDSNFQKEQLKLVFKYLVTHSYPHPVSVELLQQPGKPEIWSVASFLVQRLHGEKIIKSFTDLSAVARDLGYPYAVASSSQGANQLTTLGFVFWVLDVLKIMDKDEDDLDCDSVSQFLLEGYTQYMQNSDNFERRRLFAAQRQPQVSEAEKSKLREELAALEAAFQARPQLANYELEIERLECENQTYLMEVIAPLDERRSQLKAAPNLSKDEIMLAQSIVEQWETRCEELSAQYTEGVKLLEQAGLPEVSEEAVEEAIRLSEETRQELEFEDLSLRAELSLLQEKKVELAQVLSSKQSDDSVSKQLEALQEACAEAKSVTEHEEAACAAERQQHSWELAEAEQALRSDLLWVRELLSAC